MVRPSKPLGFIVGILLGFNTRDYFLYPYPIRVQDLEEDFNHFEEESNKREKEVEQKISLMAQQFDQAQGIYITKKHQQFEDHNDNDSKTTPKKSQK